MWIFYHKGDDIVTTFKELKNLYEDGYRCIYQDNSKGNHTIYLKNFDSEHSQVMEINDENEFDQFQSYMNDLKM